MSTNTDDAETRATDFMHALAASEVDAANISGEPTGAGAMVHVWLRPDAVADAEVVAAEYGFELYGETLTELKAKYNRAAAGSGRKRYRFETEA